MSNLLLMIISNTENTSLTTIGKKTKKYLWLFVMIEMYIVKVEMHVFCRVKSLQVNTDSTCKSVKLCREPDKPPLSKQYLTMEGKKSL